MNIDLLLIGKTDSEHVRELEALYKKRVNHYCRFDTVVIPDVRNTRALTEEAQKKAEGAQILKNISQGDFVVLLDERGKEFRSTELADWLSKRMVSGLKRLVFVVGGPYGFAPEVYERADARLSLSRMTFSHQLVRALFAEQLYRAFTILAGEPYHHE